MPSSTYISLIPESGTHRTFKRWVLDEVWRLTCIRGHLCVLPIDWMYVDGQPSVMCSSCAEELHHFRLINSHLIQAGIVPSWFPRAALEKQLNGGSPIPCWDGYANWGTYAYHGKTRSLAKSSPRLFLAHTATGISGGRVKL